MFDPNSYAIVDIFNVTVAEEGTMCGVAAPASGMKPSAIKLIVSGETISAARATRFSADAANDKIRLGWCGFEIGGLQAASALGSPIQIRCVASDAILQTWNATEIHRMHFIKKKTEKISIFQYLDLIKMTYSCNNLEQVIPFILHYHNKFGDKLLCETILKYFFGRDFSEFEIEENLENLKSFSHIKDYLYNIKEKLQIEQESKEFIRPGPFEGSFPFGIEVFS